MDKRYLEQTMRMISNIIYNSKNGGATKEQITSSLERMLDDYNRTFNKDLK